MQRPFFSNILEDGYAYAIGYDARYRMVVAHAKLPLHPAEYSAFNEATLQALVHYDTYRLLRDVRNNGLVSQENQERMVQDWIPRLLALPMERIIHLVAEDAFNQFAFASVQERLQDAPHLAERLATVLALTSTNLQAGYAYLNKEIQDHPVLAQA